MHTHRHAVEGLFLRNGCILSAGAALNWVASLVGHADVGGGLLNDVEAAGISPSDTPVFTPYLAGERTPHHNPALTAAFSGLRQFSFDKIKIDRSFVRDLAANAQSLAFIRTIVGLAVTLEIPVCVEGGDTGPVRLGSFHWMSRGARLPY
jgi:sugar (pentulose or hexulose) kinase